VKAGHRCAFTLSKTSGAPEVRQPAPELPNLSREDRGPHFWLEDPFLSRAFAHGSSSFFLETGIPARAAGRGLPVFSNSVLARPPASALTLFETSRRTQTYP
jgi:hypothetical protein